MIFSGVKSITIPEGKVKKITARAKYTNQVPLSTEADGKTIYNGGLGYKNGYRIRSGGAEAESSAHSCTGFMPCKAGGVLRVIPSTVDNTSELVAINVYDVSKTNLGQLAYNGKYGIFADTTYAWSNVDGVYTFTVPTDITNASDIAFVRITTNSRDGAVTIITINEPIADVVLWEKPMPKYTNLFDPDKALLNVRTNSSGGTTACVGFAVSDFIDVIGKTPFTADTKIYVKGANFNIHAAEQKYHAKITAYKAKPSTGYSGAYSAADARGMTITDEGNGVISVKNIQGHFPSGVKYMLLVLNVKDTAITYDDIKNIVVTIDEPIV